MKFQTAVLFFLVFFAVWVSYAFFQSENNAQILTGYFTLWGSSFKVLNGFLLAMLIAAVLPASYFSVKYLQLARELRLQKEEGAQVVTFQKEHQAVASLLDHGRYDDLLARLKGKQDPMSLLLIGKTQLFSHRPAEAIEPLRQAFFEGEIIEAGYLLAKAYRSNRQSAIAVLEALIERDPQDAQRAYKLLLEAQDRKGLWAACLETAAAMKSMGFPVDEKSLVGFRFEVIYADSGGGPKKIIDHYQQFLKTTPDFVPAYLAIGDCHVAMGATEKALAVWERGYSQTHDSVFLEKLENYYLDQNRPEDAIKIYREILMRDDDPVLRYRLAKLYFKLEMLDESLQLLESLGPSFDVVPGVLTDLGDILARRRLFEEAYQAIARFEQAWELPAESHLCRSCGAGYDHWRARCDHCRQWNQITSKAATVVIESVPTSPLYY